MKTYKRKYRRSRVNEIVVLALAFAGIIIPLLYTGVFFARLG